MALCDSLTIGIANIIIATIFKLCHNKKLTYDMIEYANAHSKLAMKPYKFQLIDTMFRHILFLGNTVRPAARNF